MNFNHLCLYERDVLSMLLPINDWNKGLAHLQDGFR